MRAALTRTQYALCCDAIREAIKTAQVSVASTSSSPWYVRAHVVAAAFKQICPFALVSTGARRHEDLVSRRRDKLSLIIQKSRRDNRQSIAVYICIRRGSRATAVAAYSDTRGLRLAAVFAISSVVRSPGLGRVTLFGDYLIWQRSRRA